MPSRLRSAALLKESPVVQYSHPARSVLAQQPHRFLIGFSKQILGRLCNSASGMRIQKSFEPHIPQQNLLNSPPWKPSKSHPITTTMVASPHSHVDKALGKSHSRDPRRLSISKFIPKRADSYTFPKDTVDRKLFKPPSSQISDAMGRSSNGNNIGLRKTESSLHASNSVLHPNTAATNSFSTHHRVARHPNLRLDLMDATDGINKASTNTFQITHESEEEKKQRIRRRREKKRQRRKQMEQRDTIAPFSTRNYTSSAYQNAVVQGDKSPHHSKTWHAGDADLMHLSPQKYSNHRTADSQKHRTDRRRPSPSRHYLNVSPAHFTGHVSTPSPKSPKAHKTHHSTSPSNHQSGKKNRSSMEQRTTPRQDRNLIQHMDLLQDPEEDPHRRHFASHASPHRLISAPSPEYLSALSKQQKILSMRKSQTDASPQHHSPIKPMTLHNKSPSPSTTESPKVHQQVQVDHPSTPPAVAAATQNQHTISLAEQQEILSYIDDLRNQLEEQKELSQRYKTLAEQSNQLSQIEDTVHEHSERAHRHQEENENEWKQLAQSYKKRCDKFETEFQSQIQDERALFLRMLEKAILDNENSSPFELIQSMRRKYSLSDIIVSNEKLDHVENGASEDALRIRLRQEIEPQLRREVDRSMVEPLQQKIHNLEQEIEQTRSKPIDSLEQIPAHLYEQLETHMRETIGKELNQVNREEQRLAQAELTGQQHQKEMESLKQQYQKEIQSLERQHQEQVQSLKQQLGDASKQTADAESKLEKENEMWKQKLEKENEMWTQKLEKENEVWTQKLENENEMWTQKLEKESKMWKQKLQSATEQVETLKSTMEQLRASKNESTTTKSPLDKDTIVSDLKWQVQQLKLQLQEKEPHTPIKTNIPSTRNRSVSSPVRGGVPPPPPPPSSGAPPPPPPPPPSAAGGAPPPPPLKKKKSDIHLPPLPERKPTVDTKTVHLSGLNNKNMTQSIWIKEKLAESTKDIYLDEKELETLFESKKVEPTSAQKRREPGKPGTALIGLVAKEKPRSTTISLVEGQRHQNISMFLIGLKHKNTQPADLAHQILVLDSNALSLERLSQLKGYIPTSEEVIVQRSFDGDTSTLDQPDQFFRELMKVPRLEARINSWIFQRKFPEIASENFPKFEKLSQASELVQNNAHWKQLLSLILAISNFLNGTHKKKVIHGFRMNSLSKLKLTKSSSTGDDRVTLLQYIVDFCKKKYPDLLSIDEELMPILQPAAKEIFYPGLVEDLSKMQSEMKKLKDEIEQGKKSPFKEDRFVEVMSEFEKQAMPQVQEMQEENSKLSDSLCSLAVQYGENSKDILKDPGPFFSNLVEFLQDWRDARKRKQ